VLLLEQEMVVFMGELISSVLLITVNKINLKNKSRACTKFSGFEQILTTSPCEFHKMLETSPEKFLFVWMSENKHLFDS
jgi:hypothetical protein